MPAESEAVSVQEGIQRPRSPAVQAAIKIAESAGFVAITDPLTEYLRVSESYGQAVVFFPTDGERGEGTRRSPVVVMSRGFLGRQERPWKFTSPRL